MGWFYGFKLHLIINHKGEIPGTKLTEGNVDDRKLSINRRGQIKPALYFGRVPASDAGFSVKSVKKFTLFEMYQQTTHFYGSCSDCYLYNFNIFNR